MVVGRPVLPSFHQTKTKLFCEDMHSEVALLYIYKIYSLCKRHSIFYQSGLIVKIF